MRSGSSNGYGMERFTTASVTSLLGEYFDVGVVTGLRLYIRTFYRRKRQSNCASEFCRMYDENLICSFSTSGSCLRPCGRHSHHGICPVFRTPEKQMPYTASYTTFHFYKRPFQARLLLFLARRMLATHVILDLKYYLTANLLALSGSC